MVAFCTEAFKVKTDIELIVERAAETLGSRAAASWLLSPAVALDRRRPTDLLGSVEGRALVRTLLLRMDYGAYC
jgi:uncharacterized protein (DUF2384 family)